MSSAREITIRGIVQGVGFRPHAYGLARDLGLFGWVLNSKSGVKIHLEGEGAVIEEFLCEVVSAAPRMSYITEVNHRSTDFVGHRDFTIRGSDDSGSRELLISPDVSTCPDCYREVFDPRDRHYRYPFTNCTNCGPRFSIISDLPYDRPHTSMHPFEMCADCAREYSDPSDRRFHAQPVACPSCGPRVSLLDPAGGVLATADEAVRRLGCDLSGGAVAAIRGLGGFHLACDAENPDAVEAIRRAKARPHRPLAVMVADPSVAEEIARIRDVERDALLSPAAPIVILQKRCGADISLAANIAPGTTSLGIMLPYTPLHAVLFRHGPRVLVMTSGNLRGLPLITDVSEAMKSLGGAADLFLIHDREILRRVDDSVLRFDSSESPHPIPHRRSRGYAPRPIVFRGPAGPAVLGTGGQEKNTFCLLDGDYAFPSQHQGDLDFEEAQDAYAEEFEDFARLLEIRPEVVAHDSHPDNFTTRFARELARHGDVTRVEVDHHHAHLASCLVDNGCEGERVLGIIADGNGYGPDGTLWGMEILHGDLSGYDRLVSLRSLPLFGGERAIRFPLRLAASNLSHYLGEDSLERLFERFPPHAADLRVALAAGEAGINSPMSSGCGRLFDAVSSYLGICLEASYGGQPAAQLSEIAGWGETVFPFELIEEGEQLTWDLADFWAALTDRFEAGEEVQRLASDFQRTLGEMFLSGARASRERASCAVVALSGGVFQNPTLLAGTTMLLEGDGFRVIRHGEVPPNDGGLSLGQVAVGRVRAIGNP